MINVITKVVFRSGVVCWFNSSVFCLSRFVKVGNNDPVDGARPVADAAPSGRQKFGARSVSLSINPPVQPATVHRGSWRLGILSSVVADSGQTKNARPGKICSDSQ
jgi:hypothetical protein